MNLRIVVSVAIAAMAAVPLLVGSSTPAGASHSWSFYHWGRTSNPFTLKVGDNVSGAWDSVLDTIVSDWTQSSVLDLAKVAGGTRGKNCRPTSGRVEVCNASYGNNGWLGLAQIWLSSGHIVQGVTKVNDTYFNTATYNTTAWRNLVMCQEVGHALGLDHQDENFDNTNLGTCMDYTRDPSTNQHPNQHDYAQLETIYSHLDSTTTVGQSTAKAPVPSVSSGRNQDDDDGGNSPSEWGQIARSRQDGRPILYRRDLSGSQRVYTWVVWADRAAPGRP